MSLPPGAAVAEPSRKGRRKKAVPADAVATTSADAAPVAQPAKAATVPGKADAGAPPSPQATTTTASGPKPKPTVAPPPLPFAKPLAVDDATGGVHVSPALRFAPFTTAAAANTVAANSGPAAKPHSSAGARLSADAVKGIMNMGNACYVAATLQAAVHCPPLAHVCCAAAVAETHQRAVAARAAAEAAAEAATDAGDDEAGAEGDSAAAATDGGATGRRGRKGGKHHPPPPPRRPPPPPPVANAPPPRLAAVLGRWFAAYWAWLPATPLTLPRGLDAVRMATGVAGVSLPADGRGQEDAQEFLSNLLRTLVDDCNALRVTLPPPAAASATSSASHAAKGRRAAFPTSPPPPDATPGGGGGGGGGRWTVVGKGKERLHVRRHEDPAATPSPLESASASPAVAAARGGSANPIEATFHGELHGATRGAAGVGRGVTSVLVEPFSSLTVPVSCPMRPGEAPTLLDCIQHALAAEKIERADDSGKAMTRETRLGFPPPPVLLIHLQRFAVTAEGEAVKLDNVLHFGPRLTLPTKLFAAPGTSANAPPSAPPSPAGGGGGSGGGGPAAGGVEYRLCAAMCHRGTSTRSGHYVTYVLPDTASAARGGPSGGGTGGAEPVVLANDGRVSPASMAALLKDTPYVLWFLRAA